MLNGMLSLNSLAHPDMAVSYRLATFSADVTPPLGHPLLAGIYTPALTVVDPLLANGFVLLGPDQPMVLVAIDWCEIRNEAYARWRTVLAEFAHTIPERVLVTCLHQHDAPLFDMEAQKLVKANQLEGKLCDLDFLEQGIQRVASALRESLKVPRRVSSIGIGQARVDKVASNRRVETRGGNISFRRSSATPDPEIREAPVGTIDPWLKTISFWDGGHPIAALSCYATHPQTHYGKGQVSSDFVGLARARMHKENRSVSQIYVTGCSGDVTVGKYNNGCPQNRAALMERLYQGLVSAWNATKRYALDKVNFHSVPLQLLPRNSPGFTRSDLNKRLTDRSLPYSKRALAAMGLSSLKHIEEGHKIDIPVIDFGPARLVLMPGETFVQYQLWAQEMRPDSFVMVIGYGECAPGYIPTAKAVAEGWDDVWMWVDPEAAEPMMMRALRKAIVPEDAP